MIDPIKNLLGRYRDWTPPELTVKKAIIAAIEKEVGISLSTTAIRVGKRGDVYLKTSPMAKAEIFLRTEKILTHLRQTLGPASPQSLH